MSFVSFSLGPDPWCPFTRTRSFGSSFSPPNWEQPMANAIALEHDRSVREQMEISSHDIARMKAFLEFRDDDADALVGLRDVARKYANPVIDEFYRHLLSFEET